MSPARRSAAVPDRAAAKAKLNDLWDRTLLEDDGHPSLAIVALVNSKQTTIRFCLPTQLLGKVISPALDALCLQKGQGTEHERWDPRSFCASVVVPWNTANQRVLGTSNDPYVGNPLRRPRLDHGLAQMRDRKEWETLCDLLGEVQRLADPQNTEKILVEVLAAIRDRLKALAFTYILPARISLNQCHALIADFLAVPSGGDRGLAVAAALFEALRERFGIYREIRRSVVNAADAATNAAGDLECVGLEGETLLVVEVKERRFDARDLQSAIAKARGRAARELLICTPGVSPDAEPEVEQLISREWAAGTNVYCATMRELMHISLTLSGEAGIRSFITQIGRQLDTFSSQPRHRTAWKSLLDRLY